MKKFPQKLNKFTVILQARMSSTRLPGKVLANLGGKPLLEFLILRLKISRNIHQIIIATTTNKKDDEIRWLFALLSDSGMRLGEAVGY